MQVFVTYSFQDHQIVQQHVGPRGKHEGVQLTYLSPSHRIGWRRRSRKLMQQADLVLHVDSEASRHSANVAWELNTASADCIPVVSLTPSELQSRKNSLYKFLCERADLREEYPNPDFRPSEATESLLEQYRLFVGTSESLVGRRQAMNTFFLTANGVIISALGLLTQTNVDSEFSYLYLLGLAIAGSLLCISWRALIVSYGQLNRGKFEVINRMEHYLPARVFHMEWIALGEGRQKHKYRSFTTTEKRIPVIVGAIYVLYSVSVIAYTIVSRLNAEP